MTTRRVRRATTNSSYATPCWEALHTSPMPTINGITMAHVDGKMKALPHNIGQG